MKKILLAVPTVVAIIGITLTVRLSAGPADGFVVESAPTPYSNDHAVAQTRGSSEESQPATF